MITSTMILQTERDKKFRKLDSGRRERWIEETNLSLPRLNRNLGRKVIQVIKMKT